MGESIAEIIARKAEAIQGVQFDAGVRKDFIKFVENCIDNNEAVEIKPETPVVVKEAEEKLEDVELPPYGQEDELED